MSEPERTSSNAPASGAMLKDRSEPHGHSRSARSRRRTVIGVIVLVLLVGLPGWQIYTGRDVWRSVWSRERRPPRKPGTLDSVEVEQQSRHKLAFDLSILTVPPNEIFSGGPPKDGIPALTQPRFIPAQEAHYLLPQDRVIGFVLGSDVRAYPLKILVYHEIVNDRVGEVPVAITYCPFCDSVAAFDRRTPLGEREFGVSGLLYNSNVLMYDRGGNPESLWSQVKTEGISLPAANHRLTTLPVELTTWENWQTRYPHPQVLSPETGYRRDYNRDPYAGYFDLPQLMFPAQPSSDRLPTKARVLGVWTKDAARAYPESAFSGQKNRIEEQVGGRKVVTEFNPAAQSLQVAEADDGVQWMYSLWFAWYAFRPDTTVFE